MRASRIWTAVAGIALSTILLMGCRAEEQGRIVEYKPGVYLGKKDSAMSDAQEQMLRERAQFQTGTGPAGTASTGGRPADVNPPK
ncbi:MAG: hypothetical protein EXQ86_07235 [Rhodospirillales bacterium]|nr:hypothetical protein [Rhodospirillales bacterium]